MTRARLRQTPDELKAAARTLKAALHDPETHPRDVAIIARELRQTLLALDEVQPAVKDDALDDLAAKRKARRASG